MPAGLEELRVCNAGSQYIMLLKGGQLRDRTQLCRTNIGKARRQPYQGFPKGARNFFCIIGLSNKALQPLLRIMI